MPDFHARTTYAGHLGQCIGHGAVPSAVGWVELRLIQRSAHANATRSSARTATALSQRRFLDFANRDRAVLAPDRAVADDAHTPVRHLLSQCTNLQLELTHRRGWGHSAQRRSICGESAGRGQNARRASRSWDRPRSTCADTASGVVRTQGWFRGTPRQGTLTLRCPPCLQREQMFVQVGAAARVL